MFTIFLAFGVKAHAAFSRSLKVNLMVPDKKTAEITITNTLRLVSRSLWYEGKVVKNVFVGLR